MGSKHALSNGNEPGEVTDLIAAFEQQNSCKITIATSLELHKGYMDCNWSAVAWEAKEGKPVVPPLVLASVGIWGGDYKTLMGVLSRLLYALDFQLALKEFGQTAVPKA